MNPPGPDESPAPLGIDLSVVPTRPASLWPDSTRAGAAASSSFAPTRFDPLADERARLDELGAAAFDVCHPALALRAVLLVQAALAVVALSQAQDLAQWLAQSAARPAGSRPGHRGAAAGRRGGRGGLGTPGL